MVFLKMYSSFMSVCALTFKTHISMLKKDIIHRFSVQEYRNIFYMVTTFKNDIIIIFKMAAITLHFLGILLKISQIILT